MSNFKLTISSVSTDPAALAEGILENYGEDFDAALGDFTTSVVSGYVEVVANDVTKGDMRILIEDIYRDFGDEADTSIRVSKQDGSSWFPTDVEDDDD
jgi:hypothetical protein